MSGIGPNLDRYIAEGRTATTAMLLARADEALRERDEARAEREKWRVYALRLMGIRDEYGEPAVLRAERDEARAEAARLRDAQIRSAGDGYRARLERDEARAEVERLRAERDQAHAAGGRAWLRLDAAFAEVERLRAARERPCKDCGRAQDEWENLAARAVEARTREIAEWVRAWNDLAARQAVSDAIESRFLSGGDDA